MKDDIKTKPYDLLIELFETRDKHKIRSGFLSSSQLNNLSFELLLFYLMFILAYLNTDEIKKILKDTNKITTYLKKNNYIFKLNRVVLSHQSYHSYKNNDTFFSLYQRINNINRTIKINKYYINFLLFIYNFIITNNSMSGSRRSSYRNSLMTNNSIKKLITKIFDIVINFTYANADDSHFIEIDEDLLDTIKYLLFKLMLNFKKYGLTSPLQCLEEFNCTDLITLDMDNILFFYEGILKEANVPIRGGKLTKKRNLKKK